MILITRFGCCGASAAVADAVATLIIIQAFECERSNRF